MNTDNTDVRRTAQQWVTDQRHRWSGWASTIFEFGETAWREYESAEWYVHRLCEEGFSVEIGRAHV